MKVLVVDDQPEMRSLICLYLEELYQPELVEAESGQQAIEKMKTHPDLDLIICDYNMKNGTGGDVYEHILNEDLGYPFILCSSDRPEYHKEFQKGGRLSAFIDKADMVDQLPRAVGIALQKRPRMDLSPEYCGVRLKTIRKVDAIPCDLYLRLSENNFIKVMRKGDWFGQEDIDKYSSKSVEYLFVHQEDIQDFVHSFVKELVSLEDLFQSLKNPGLLRETARRVRDEDLKEDLVTLASTLEMVNAGDLGQGAAFEIANEVHRDVHEMILRIGLSTETEQLVKASVHLAVETLEDIPQLNQLLAQLRRDPEHYINTHSVALSYISCEVASLMEWCSASTRYKLAIASFMHDIALANHELARFNSMSEIRSSGLNPSPEELKAFEDHPSKAAELIRNLRQIPPDVDTIVLQHHERPDGSGFPAGLAASRISPLSCVFIIAHDLSNFHLEREGSVGLKEFLKERGDLYKEGNFKPILKALWANQTALA